MLETPSGEGKRRLRGERPTSRPEKGEPSGVEPWLAASRPDSEQPRAVLTAARGVTEKSLRRPTAKPHTPNAAGPCCRRVTRAGLGASFPGYHRAPGQKPLAVTSSTTPPITWNNMEHIHDIPPIPSLINQAVCFIMKKPFPPSSLTLKKPRL